MSRFFHMICSGINQRWSPYEEIFKANKPAIDSLLTLLENISSSKGGNDADCLEAAQLISAISKFIHPKSPYFYMNHGGNALRFNQVLSKACRLTDSVYIVGCKSGHDRTFLQTVFNAAANGSPNPGVLHLSNTVIDTAATPKAKCSKFSTACKMGFFPVASSAGGAPSSMQTVSNPTNTPALAGEIANPIRLKDAADQYPEYDQLGIAHHKAQRGFLQKAAKSVSIHVVGHTKDEPTPPKPS